MKVTEYDDITQKLENTHASHSNSTQKKQWWVPWTWTYSKQILGYRWIAFILCSLSVKVTPGLKCVWSWCGPFMKNAHFCFSKLSLNLQLTSTIKALFSLTKKGGGLVSSGNNLYLKAELLLTKPSLSHHILHGYKYKYRLWCLYIIMSL